MKKILIIDDDAAYSLLVQTCLQETGDFEVMTATTGQAGLKIARMQQPALILLDIQMPQWSGFEVLKRLKEDPTTIAIPVLMLTAFTDEEMRREPSLLLPEYFIVKPVGMKALKLKIESVLSKTQGTG